MEVVGSVPRHAVSNFRARIGAQVSIEIELIHLFCGQGQRKMRDTAILGELHSCRLHLLLLTLRFLGRQAA